MALSKKACILFLVCTLLISTCSVIKPTAAVAATDSPDIEIILSADAVSNNLDLTGFSDKLKERLNTTYNISPDKVHISAVQSNSYQGGSSGWYIFDHTNNNSFIQNTETALIQYYNENFGSYNPELVQDRHIQFTNNNNTIVFYGYGAPAYRDFLYMPNNDANNKIFTFTVNETAVSYHTVKGAGFLFNASYTYNAGVRRLSGYYVSIGQSMVYLYKLDNVDVNTFTQGVASDGTLVTSAVKPAGTIRYLKLVASPTQVSLTQYTDNTYGTISAGGNIFSNVALDQTFGSFGFGPISTYNSHGCWELSKVVFDNLKMVSESSVSFTDMVRSATWNYQNSFRLIANVDNDGIPDLGSVPDTSTILYYMMLNNVHYAGWGLNNNINIGGATTVKGQADAFIARNSDRGTFINRSDANYDSLDEGVDALALYIAGQLDLIPDIDKPVINTEFNGNGNVTCTTPTTQTSAGNAIQSYEWRSMDVANGAWTELDDVDNTTSFTFAQGTYNYISLRIQDAVTHKWSEYATAYVANDTNAPPIAQFSVNPSELMPDSPIDALKTGTVITASDASYHPAGEALTDWEWRVYNSTLNEVGALAKTYTSATKPESITFDFTGQAGGKYTIKLRVKKGTAGWSEYFSQDITLFKESNNLTITRTSQPGEEEITYSEPVTINYTITSTGSNVSNYRLIKIPLSSGDTLIGDWVGANAQTVLASTTLSSGSYNIYAQAKDTAGNSKTQLLGKYSALVPKAPSVTTDAAVTNITSTTVTLGGEVTKDNGKPVTERGICYSTSATPTINDSKATADGTIGTFTVDIEGLTPNTKYYYCAYAKNLIGTGYGSIESFTTNRVRTIAFDTDGGSAIPSQTISGAGQKAIRPATNPTRPGYVFDNWYKDGLTELFNFDQVLTDDTTIHAKWIANTYTVSKSEGAGTTITLPGTTAKCGTDYTFTVSAKTGYSGDDFEVSVTIGSQSYIPDKDGNKYTIRGSAILGNITISTGSQSLKTYTVTFKDYDGEILKTVTVKYGSAASAPVNPTRPGYKFTGWDKSFSNVTNNLTVTAKYSLIPTPAPTVKPTPTPSLGPLSSATPSVTLSPELQSELGDAARALTSSNAFTFAQGDTWECITSDFFAVNAGINGTSISWTSSNPSIVRLQNQTTQTLASITRPESRDESVILTATIKKGSATVTKTFLLIIKDKAVNKSAEDTRQQTTREAEAQTGGGENTQDLAILRTTLNNDTTIDTVIFDPEKISDLAENINENGTNEEDRTVHVTVDEPENDPADEIALEIPSESILLLAEKNAAVEITTEEGTLLISSDSMKQIANSGTDLFFRIEPIVDKQEQQEARDSLSHDGAVFNIVGGSGLQSLGIPRKIVTNMQGYATTVILPLDGIDIPSDPAAQQEFLNSLRIYVEHSDGTTELLTGSIVHENGAPTGIRFDISKFSRFQIVRIDKSAAASSLIWIIIPVFVLAAGALTYILIKRRKKKETEIDI